MYITEYLVSKEHLRPRRSRPVTLRRGFGVVYPLFVVTLIVCGFFCVRFLFCGVLSGSAIILLRKGELVASRSCLCSVSLPRSVVGWSAVFDCGISWSCSLSSWI